VSSFPHAHFESVPISTTRSGCSAHNFGSKMRRAVVGGGEASTYSLRQRFACR